MGIFDRLFGSRKSDDEPGDELLEYPWDRSPSIFEHIRAHIRPGDPGLSEGGETLPDEERLEGDIRWVAGA